MLIYNIVLLQDIHRKIDQMKWIDIHRKIDLLHSIRTKNNNHIR